VRNPPLDPRSKIADECDVQRRWRNFNEPIAIVQLNDASPFDGGGGRPE
jgi:hypothetical protein